MGNESDASSHQPQQDCSRAKKSRTEQFDALVNVDVQAVQSLGHWDCLPTVLLDEIFKHLDFTDTINASSTCCNWRQSLFHPRKWHDVTFVIEPQRLAKAKFLRLSAGTIVNTARIRFNSIELACTNEFLQLLQCLALNNNLKSLVLEPSHSTIDLPESVTIRDEVSLHRILFKIYSKTTMTTLHLGCSEELFEYLPELLETINEQQAARIELMALATIKEDPFNYFLQSINAQQLQNFRALQILSLDYDNLNDEALDALQHVANFQRLVVHLHGICDDHPSTSENAWARLRKAQPNFLLRLACIHSLDEVKHLHNKVLKKNMPLSHLKILFCEHMNFHILNKVLDYRETLVSLMWVDNIANQDHAALLRDPDIYTQPLELVIVAWQCKQLKELVILGYSVSEEDWVGILRLRSNTFKRLEIAESDVFHVGQNRLLRTGKRILGKAWKLQSVVDLHPSIVDPNSTDTDEYIMPILLADLK